MYRFINIQTKQIILSRDIQWLISFWKEYKKRIDGSKKLVDEFYSHEEDDQTQDESETEEPREKENEETKESHDGNNTEEQMKLGIDIQMIGAKEEELGMTRSQTQEMMSPRNESMERAELTMEDWIHETCLISAVTSGPTEPKTFQGSWYSPVEEERNNWQIAIRKEIKSMINRGVWRNPDKVKIPENRRLIVNKWVFKIKRDGTYRARLVALGYSQIPGVDNVGAIWLSNNRNTGDRTKLIDKRTAFMKEYHEDGKIIIIFVKSEDNEADIFTKNTSNIIFQRHQEKLVSDKKEVMEDK